MEENKMFCFECGREVENGEYYTTANGKIICDSCYDNYYFTCNDCEQIFRQEDEIFLEYYEYPICGECLDNNYYECSDCGNYHMIDETHELSNGAIICGNCYDFGNYGTCRECGGLFHGDDVRYNDSDDEYYCCDCYSNLFDDRIYSYHDFNEWKTYKTEEEKEPLFYIGHELEIEPGNYDYEQKKAVSSVYNNLKAICMNDGSLDTGGFEIISHPQTIEYFKKNYNNYKKCFEELKNAGYISHDASNCGLHFHVTRQTTNNEEIINRLWVIMENFKIPFTQIARRSNNSYAKFLSDKMTNNNKVKKMYFIKKYDKNIDRYLAINNRNNKTIEFRLFKGTLNVDTFFATIELVYNIYNIACDLSINLENITFDMLTQGEYIQKYCREKNITCNVKIDTDDKKYIVLENKINNLMNEILINCKKDLRNQILDNDFNINKNLLKNKIKFDINKIDNELSKSINEQAKISSNIAVIRSLLRYNNSDNYYDFRYYTREFKTSDELRQQIIEKLEKIEKIKEKLGGL